MVPKCITSTLMGIFSLFVLAGCGAFSSIDRYTSVRVIPDNAHVYVLTPAPRSLQAYDSSVAAQWDRTYNHCAQLRKAVLIELGQRESRVSARRTLLLSLGGMAGLANAIYTGIKKDPEKEVTVPLSILSGTALLSFLPSFGDDDQIPDLRSKLTAMNQAETKASDALMVLDKALTEQAFIDQEEDEATDVEVKKRLHERSKENIRRLDDLTAVLKQALVNWTNEAQ